MLAQLAMLVVCAACQTTPIETKPAVYYVPEPKPYSRPVVTPKAARDLQQLEDDLRQLQDVLKKPAETDATPAR